MPHMTLAQHFFLDALDLCERFHAHWEEQPRKSARIKSFVDLLMACECMLKAKCLLARQHLPIAEAHKEVRGLGHDINKLVTAVQMISPSEVNERARKYFGPFSVGLRYSVDSYEYFFPIGGSPRAGRPTYGETLGNACWMSAAIATVEELIVWGRTSFNGEVDDDIESILTASVEVEAALQHRLQRTKRSTH